MVVLGTGPLARRQNPRKRDDPQGGLRPVSLEEAELVEKVKAGHTEAYGELVRRYEDRVFNTCWRICGHLEDARDLTQDAFVKGFENISTFRHESGFYTWIFRVAVNLALSHRRKGIRRRAVLLEQAGGAEGTQAESLAGRVGRDAGDDPARTASDGELQGLVARALQGLDDDQRAVVVLRDIEGLDYHEIGVILEIPPGTVRSRLHRARMALREAVLPSLSR
jgi:RNA polymerase sigma-70 factor (ECF subfamily)